MTTSSNETNSPRRETSLLFGFIPLVPAAFLGLGIYRAWIEVVFVGSFVDLPPLSGAATGNLFNVRDIFDATMAAVSLMCALCAKRIGPLSERKAPFTIGVICLTLSTVLMFSSRFIPGETLLVGTAAAIAGGVGIAFLILIWSELYGCLNPLRVATYYSLAIVAGAIIVFIWRGFMFPWLFVMTSLLPLASILCARKGFASLPSDERPQRSWAGLSVPWKAIILMATYAFSYGLLETTTYSGLFGPHSAPGALIAALVVFFAVSARGKRFNFGGIYRVALPLMIAALLFVPSLKIFGSAAGGFCVAAGYTAQSILVMVVLTNLCYRYGASALWLFGIERGVRQIAMLAGRAVQNQATHLESFGIDGAMLISMLSVIAIVSATMIFMSERGLSSTWGAKLPEDGEPGQPSASRTRHELSSRVAQVARTYKLSAREEEVLLLLAQRKTVGVIERELFIANGTAKAHVRHIYQKLDIHTRQELFDMVGVEADDGQDPR